MSQSETAAALLVVWAAYPHTEWSLATQTVYLDHLSDIPADELKVVISQAIASCKFPPTIAELRDTWHASKNAGKLTWADAWDKVMGEMRRIGSYGVPQFDDELTARIVKTMGWKTLCASENTQTDRAQFRDMYNAISARQETNQKLLPQARELAERNSANGMISMRNLLGMNGAGNE